MRVILSKCATILRHTENDSHYEKSNIVMTEILAETLIQELRKTGCRITQARLAVVAVLAQSTQPLKPMEIMSQARRFYPSVNLATVYRTLDVLQVAQCVSRVRLDAEASVVVACHRTALHVHLICRQCRQVMECDVALLAAHVEQAMQTVGFTPQSRAIELVGLCKTCQQEVEP